jgi:hypothetical protein
LTVLAHGDADGVSSAAVVKAALAGEYEAVKVYFTHPVDLAKDFEAFAEGDVYIVDVAIDEKTAEEVRRAFRSYGGRVVYIDHHPLSVDLPGVEVVHEVDMEPRKLLVHVVQVRAGGLRHGHVRRLYMNGRPVTPRRRRYQSRAGRYCLTFPTRIIPSSYWRRF